MSPTIYLYHLYRVFLRGLKSIATQVMEWMRGSFSTALMDIFSFVRKLSPSSVWWVSSFITRIAILRKLLTLAKKHQYFLYSLFTLNVPNPKDSFKLNYTRPFWSSCWLWKCIYSVKKLVSYSKMGVFERGNDKNSYELCLNTLGSEHSPYFKK